MNSKTWAEPLPYHDTPVREFHEIFEHPISYKPVVPSIEQRLLRVKLLAEELCEFAAAAGVVLTIGNRAMEPLAMDNYEPDIHVREARNATVDLVECADGLGDLRYLVDGGNLIFGFPGERVLSEIHRSNMSKLGADGKPIRREDGKTLKGPGYFKPDIAGAIGLAETEGGDHAMMDMDQQEDSPPTMEQIVAHISECLATASLALPPFYAVTFLARFTPENPQRLENDILLSQDDLGQAIETLQRLQRIHAAALELKATTNTKAH